MSIRPESRSRVAEMTVLGPRPTLQTEIANLRRSETPKQENALRNCSGLLHRLHFAVARSRSGCIGRQQEGVVLRRSGEIHRPQFGVVKNVVKLMALGAFGEAAFVTKV